MQGSMAFKKQPKKYRAFSGDGHTTLKVA